MSLGLGESMQRGLGELVEGLNEFLIGHQDRRSAPTHGSSPRTVQGASGRKLRVGY